MVRGGGGMRIFEEDDHRNVFLARLGRGSGRYRWRIHAWMLMGNKLAKRLEELDNVLNCEDWCQ